MSNGKVLAVIRGLSGQEPRYVTQASKGPWFGFNGLYTFAVIGGDLWVGRQSTPWSQPAVSKSSLGTLNTRALGSKRVSLDGVGTVAFRTGADAAAFLQAISTD